MVLEFEAGSLQPHERVLDASVVGWRSLREDGMAAGWFPPDVAAARDRDLPVRSFSRDSGIAELSADDDPSRWLLSHGLRRGDRVDGLAIEVASCDGEPHRLDVVAGPRRHALFRRFSDESYRDVSVFAEEAVDVAEQLRCGDVCGAHVYQRGLHS